jgi:hypothetical protein
MGINSKTDGSRSSVVCDVASLGELFPTFPRNVMHSSSRLKWKPDLENEYTTFMRNVGNTSRNDAASCRRPGPPVIPLLKPQNLAQKI